MTKAEKIKAEKAALEKLAATAEQLKQDFTELFHVEQAEPDYEKNAVDLEIASKEFDINYHAEKLIGQISILKKLAE